MRKPRSDRAGRADFMIDTGHQAILLLNRRGYSNFVYCSSCGEVVQCKYCDTTMTYHRSANSQVLSAATDKGVHTGQLHCHYCLAVNPLPAVCPVCQMPKLVPRSAVCCTALMMGGKACPWIAGPQVPT